MATKSNSLKHGQVCKLAIAINAIKDELMEAKPSSTDVALRMSRELGFSVTKANVIHLITEEVVPDFRPAAPNPGQFRGRDSKAIREVETLRQIVEEQGKRIHNLEVQLGVEKLDSRLNGKHKAAM